MTGLTLGTSGGNKTAGAMFVGTSGGNKAVQVGYVGTASGNKVFFASLTVDATPPDFTQTTVVAPDTNVNGPATANVTGGVGPFTYLWTRTGGSASVNADNVTGASTNFAMFQASAGIVTSTWVCTVTDTSTGISAVTNSVTTHMRAL